LEEDTECVLVYELFGFRALNGPPSTLMVALATLRTAGYQTGSGTL
jgi:hypothetical protein